MYTLAVAGEFIASHFLVGGDWGEENLPHSHHYRMEVQISGESLDGHGYLADIIQIRQMIEGQVGRYRNRTLNSLPEFEGRNPSIELLARTLADDWARQLGKSENLRRVRVKVWEDRIAWASFTGHIRNGGGG